MSDEENKDGNVTTIHDKNQSGKQPKDPKKAALSKIAEGSIQEWNKKIEAQVKKTVDAIKIAATEKKTLADLIEESEEAKTEYADLIKEI